MSNTNACGDPIYPITGNSRIATTTTTTVGTCTGGTYTLTVPYNPTAPSTTIIGTPYPTPFPSTPPHTTLNEPEEEFDLPKCTKCRKPVDSCKSFISKNVLTMIFHCHDENRRIDIGLRKFNGNETDARNYLLEQNDYLFDEEARWRTLHPKHVHHENADKSALSRWLTNQ